jgi:predicted transcriptional regulator
VTGETRLSESGWTTDTLRVYFESRLDDMRAGLDERYETQTKATDAAFVAQQTAMRTAFDAADRAVQAALQAVKEASDKADAASEKRFDSVNEFRNTLSDQASRLMPRIEAEARIQAMTDRADDAADRNATAIRALELRLETVPGAAERDAIQKGFLARDSALVARINALEISKGEAVGHAVGISQSVATVLSATAIIVTVIIAIITIILTR